MRRRLGWVVSRLETAGSVVNEEMVILAAAMLLVLKLLPKVSY